MRPRRPKRPRFALFKPNHKQSLELSPGTMFQLHVSRFQSENHKFKLRFCSSPNSGDCVSITTDSIPYTDPLMISTSPSEIYPWSTVQEPAPKEMPSPHPRQPTSTSWLPSSSVSTDYTPSSSIKPPTFTKSRSGSYGRSSWSDSTTNTQLDTNTPSTTNTHQIYSSSTPNWPTVTTWHVATEANLNTPDLVPIDNIYSTRADSQSQSATQTWFPAAGNQLANEVDEPNQQGLTKPENSAPKTLSNLLSLTLIAILALIP